MTLGRAPGADSTDSEQQHESAPRGLASLNSAKPGRTKRMQNKMGRMILGAMDDIRHRQVEKSTSSRVQSVSALLVLFHSSNHSEPFEIKKKLSYRIFFVIQGVGVQLQLMNSGTCLSSVMIVHKSN